MNNDKDFLTILGPLAPFYTDPTVSQIVVDAPDRVYLQQPDEWNLIKAEVTFDSTAALQHVIDQLAALGGLTFGPEQNSAEIRLPDGARVIAVIPPTASDGPYLVIRKADNTRWDTFTWEHLLEIGTLTAEAHSLLMKALDSYVNVLVVGNHNSGKNYTANLMAESLPPKVRVIVVADPYEMPVRHPRRIHLEVGRSSQASFDQVLATAAKMRPDWLVLGDMAGPEAMQAVQLMNSGRQVLTTLYAADPEDALTRLESMCLMANPSLGLDQIRHLVASAIGLITYQQNHTLPDYRIKITRIIEIQGVENGRYILQPLFTYDLEQGVLQATEAAHSYAERMRHRLTHG